MNTPATVLNPAPKYREFRYWAKRPIRGEPSHRFGTYAAADNAAKAERAIRLVLTAYLEAHPDSRPGARIRVARFTDQKTTKVDIVSVAALVGAKRSATKARASRANGQLGGRPRKAATPAPLLKKTPR